MATARGLRRKHEKTLLRAPPNGVCVWSGIPFSISVVRSIDRFYRVVPEMGGTLVGNVRESESESVESSMVDR